MDENFFVLLEEANATLGHAREQEAILDGMMDALVARLMQEHDEAFRKQTGKSLSIELQKRSAKADPRYAQAVCSHAKAVSNRTLAQGRCDVLKLRFEAWRTKSANKRSSL